MPVDLATWFCPSKVTWLGVATPWALLATTRGEATAFLSVACGCRGRAADVTEEDTGTVDEADLGGTKGRRLFLRPAMTSTACVPMVTLADREFGKTFLQRRDSVFKIEAGRDTVHNILEECCELITGENGTLAHLGAVYQVVSVQLHLLHTLP